MSEPYPNYCMMENETTDEYEQRVIKEMDATCPMMHKCGQLIMMHKELVASGKLLDKREGKFYTEYVMLAQSVYDDFALQGPSINQTAKRWRATALYNYIECNSIMDNMRYHCDTSAYTRLMIPSPNSKSLRL